MDPDKLASSLTELVKKFVLSFCQVNVEYSERLDVFGSIHVRCDDCDVVAFVLNERCYRNEGDGNSKKSSNAHQSQTIKKEVVNNEDNPADKHKNLSSSFYTESNKIKQESNMDDSYNNSNNYENPDVKYTNNINNSNDDIIDINDEEDDVRDEDDNNDVSGDYNDDNDNVSANYIDSFMEAETQEYSSATNNVSNNYSGRFSRSFQMKNVKRLPQARPTRINPSKKIKTEPTNNYKSYSLFRQQQQESSFSQSASFSESQNDGNNSEYMYAYQPYNNNNDNSNISYNVKKRRRNANSLVPGPGMVNGQAGLDDNYFQASYSHRVKFHNISNGGGVSGAKNRNKSNLGSSDVGAGYGGDGYADDGDGGADGYS
ncbi:hypothetical protein HELRODRAFT_169710 [Helobdella robusta]|uniref:Uncharacterized protein n=1 Tax=Helobdella robusta TaxID=6412 RepID=T1F293_HELRO|nr:hypothetical protein HELRODRAFT_169710 [Helobdella robusta]ESO07992.1 hypothetical protein HELRODRAFT_169710 [Helobdella robusta]